MVAKRNSRLACSILLLEVRLDDGTIVIGHFHCVNSKGRKLADGGLVSYESNGFRAIDLVSTKGRSESMADKARMQGPHAWSERTGSRKNAPSSTISRI